MEDGSEDCELSTDELVLPRHTGMEHDSVHRWCRPGRGASALRRGLAAGAGLALAGCCAAALAATRLGRPAAPAAGVAAMGPLLLTPPSGGAAPSGGSQDGLIQAWVAPTETSTTTYTTTHPLGPDPTLFCWSHMEPGTSEVALIRLQLVKRASIFACNYAAVVSSHKFLLGNIDGTDVWTWVNPTMDIAMGKRGVDGATTDSFLNTEIFLIAWDTLMGSNQIWPYDFVVKVDPDAVFFPDRLRKHVAPHVGKPVYFSNCGKYGGEVLLYGSLEVFSTQALRRYEQGVEECRKLPWKGWGEDYYMQHCMNQLGVENVPDTEQVGDDRCVSAACSDYTRVAYHDFKDPKGWFECFEQAVSR